MWHEIEKVNIISCDGLWQDHENIRMEAYSLEGIPDLGLLS